jgi:hypothetical protein
VEDIMQREEILDRYRNLRAVSMRHQTAAVNFVARSAILQRAKYLGLAQKQAIVAESEEEMTLIFDLAVHTAKAGQSRAIDRYTKTAVLSCDSDEARTLDAICQARFSVWRIERFHEVAGLIVTDVLRGSETWLVDEALTISARPGLTFASRLFWPAEFAMTCGVVVPVDAELLENVVLNSRTWLRHAEPDQLADDPRFAAAIYRTAIDRGIMNSVEFKGPMMGA